MENTISIWEWQEFQEWDCENPHDPCRENGLSPKEEEGPLKYFKQGRVVFKKVI